ncbi:unnamed protein product [Citrullus colocynthis]|uniref:Uncharacterized protein n=1 Tax=Citrullus colocynthis TaxID=252529 RepID=A0ABP0Y509_9ROSI
MTNQVIRIRADWNSQDLCEGQMMEDHLIEACMALVSVQDLPIPKHEEPVILPRLVGGSSVYVNGSKFSAMSFVEIYDGRKSHNTIDEDFKILHIYLQLFHWRWDLSQFHGGCGLRLIHRGGLLLNGLNGGGLEHGGLSGGSGGDDGLKLGLGERGGLSCGGGASIGLSGVLGSVVVVVQPILGSVGLYVPYASHDHQDRPSQ